MVRRMSGSSSTVRMAVAVAAAAMAGAAPLTAHADGQVLTQASVCTISVVIAPGTPVSATPTAPWISYGLTGAGACSGSPQGALSLVGSGITVGPATCATFVSQGAEGLVTIGGQTSAIVFDLAGPTAALAMSVQPQQVGNGVAGAAALVISPASLAACLAGGASSLVYTGVAVFAL